MKISSLIRSYRAAHEVLRLTIDKKVKMAIAEYNILRKKFSNQYPKIQRHHYINIQYDQYIGGVTITIVAIPENPKLAEYDSDGKADVVDKFFQKILKKHLPNQKNFTVRGNIQASIIAQPFNPNR